jgi:hypothetical protein
MEDPETGELFTVDTFYENRLLKERSAALDSAALSVFKKAKVDVINLDTKASYIRPLVKFFKERERRITFG